MNPPDLSHPTPFRSKVRRRLKPTPRYYALVDLLYRYRILTDRQIHAALFQSTTPRGCQRTLTLLTQHKWIDRYARRYVSQPYIYTLSPKSTVGNKLMKAKYGETEFRMAMYKPTSLSHTLAINDVRVSVERFYKLDTWRRADQLVELLPKSYRLIPDAYFRISDDGVTYGFFLELQRSLKSNRILISKLERYSQLFTSEGFPQQFMRVLVIFTTELSVSSASRVAQAQRLIPGGKYPFARLLRLEDVWSGSCSLVPSSNDGQEQLASVRLQI